LSNKILTKVTEAFVRLLAATISCALSSTSTMAMTLNLFIYLNSFRTFVAIKIAK